MTAGLSPPPFPHGFPLRENCNRDDPYQAFLWMLVALPGQQGGQLVMPVSYLQLVSKRLWELGARPVEEPVLKYRKPGTLAPNWITSPGDWVPIDAPDDDPRTPARRAADSLVPMQKAELIRELAKDLTPRQKYEFMQKLAEHEQSGGEPE
jgi:hypothetical protein